MTRRELKQYPALRRELKRLKERRANLKPCSVSDVVEGSSKGHPYTKHSIPVAGIDMREAHRLDRKIEENEKRISEIESFVDGIEDIKTREIIEYFYLLEHSWTKIAVKMNYKSGESPRKKIERFFKTSVLSRKKGV